jgi:hypothetical protein
MPPWLAAVLAGCAVAITIAIVLAVLSARRALERTAAILAIAEREMTPIAAEARGLTGDARALTQEATRELRRAGDVVDRVHDTADGVSRIVHALAGLTRAGQMVGVATAVRRGVEVFAQRMRKNGGNHHGG